MTLELRPETTRMPLIFQLSMSLTKVPPPITAIVIERLLMEFEAQNGDDPPVGAAAQIASSNLTKLIGEFVEDNDLHIDEDYSSIISRTLFHMNEYIFLPPTISTTFSQVCEVFKPHSITLTFGDLVFTYSLNSEIWWRVYRSTCSVERLHKDDFLLRSSSDTWKELVNG